MTNDLYKKNPASGNAIPRESLAETRGEKDHCISLNLFYGNLVLLPCNNSEESSLNYKTC